MFGNPQPSFGAPAQNTGFGQPQAGFGQQTTGFGQPATGFGYAATQPAFGAPPTFGQPQTGFGTTQPSTFQQPAMGFGQQPSTFGQPQTGFSSPGFGAANTGFQAQKPGFGMYNQPSTFQPQAGFGQPQSFGGNQFGGYGASGVQSYQQVQTQAVPTCVACNVKYYVGGLADGTMQIINRSQPQNPQSLSLGRPIMSLDILEDEAIVGTSAGLVLVNLQQGLMKQLTNYNLPVPCVRYANNEYAIASFVAADASGQPKRKQQLQSTGNVASRWNTPATQSQGLLCYELQIVDLRQGSVVATSKEIACSGLFALMQETAQYNQALARVHVPGVQGYEQYAVQSFSIKKSGNAHPRFDSQGGIQFNAQQQVSGISAVAAGGNFVSVAYENGELCVFKQSGSQYSSYRSYSTTSQNPALQSMGCRVNALLYYNKTQEFVVALQRGQVCTLKEDGTYGVTVKQAQAEVTCVALDANSSVAVIGVGNLQQVLDSKQGQFITFGVNEIGGKIQQGN